MVSQYEVMLKRLSLMFISVASLAMMSACDSANKAAAQQAGAPAAVAVTVKTVLPQDMPLTLELPGRTTSYGVAEIRPQVTGVVKKRLFVEGSIVQAGQALYQIEPAVYQASFDQAKASLAKAQANLESVSLKAARYADLVKIEAVSKQANDDVLAAEKQAKADVAMAKALLDRAKIDLDFTRIVSPITGRIGRSSVTEGALVTANQASVLAVVQQLNPVYVDITQSSTELLRLNRNLAAGKVARAQTKTVPVELVLEDGSVYESKGYLAFSEMTVDPTTGSVTLRAVVPNPKTMLLPGMYVRAKIAQTTQKNAFLIPHIALSRDPKGNALAMVVNAENKVEARPIQAVQSTSTDWVVSEGLKKGDRVVVDGLQKIRPGALVKPEEMKPAEIEKTPTNASVKPQQ
jgi:membrane fusion protein (multidrug efflux system)